MIRKFFAIIMIGLIVLTVFGTVAATAQSTSVTQKVTQKNQQVINKVSGGGAGVYDPYLVPLGQNRVWDEKSFNVHDTKLTYTDNMDPKGVTGSSVTSTLATQVNAKNVVQYSGGTSSAWLGVQFQIKGLSSPQVWALVSPAKKVQISATVDYTLSGITGIGKAAAVTNAVNLATGADPTKPTLVKNMATLNIDKVGTKDTISMTQVKVTVITTLDKLGTGKPGQCEITVPLYTSAFGSDASAEAAGNVVVHDIQFTWL
jgi:hypothetical protein